MSNSSSKIEHYARVAIDCGFRIHHDIGPGLLESAYESFLAASLRAAGLKTEQQKPVAVTYNGIVVRDAFRADLVVEDELIIELKSVEKLLPVHSKQLLTYLRLTQRPLGLLMNFGSAMFRDGIKRVINDRSEYVAPKS